MNMVKNIVLKFELSVQIHITHREILDTRLWRVNLQNNDSDIYLDLFCHKCQNMYFYLDMINIYLLSYYPGNQCSEVLFHS